MSDVYVGLEPVVVAVKLIQVPSGDHAGPDAYVPAGIGMRRTLEPSGRTIDSCAPATTMDPPSGDQAGSPGAASPPRGCSSRPSTPMIINRPGPDVARWAPGLSNTSHLPSG